MREFLNLASGRQRKKKTFYTIYKNSIREKDFFQRFRFLNSATFGIFSRTKLLYHWIYIFIMLALSHASFPFFTELYPVLCTSGAVYGLSFGFIGSQSVPVIVQVLNQKLASTGIAIEFTIYGLCNVLGGYICG